MVDFDERGVYADYDPVTHKATHYWVVSLEPHVMTAKRLPALCLRNYVHGAIIDETLRVIMTITMIPIMLRNYKRLDFILIEFITFCHRP